jgi:hypothetical protein
MGSVSLWGDDRLTQLMTLWHCYEKRENSSIQAVSQVSLQQGELVKHYHAEEEAGMSSRQPESMSDHIEMTPLGQGGTPQSRRSELVVRHLSGLVRTGFDSKRTLFSSEARRVLARRAHGRPLVPFN